MRNSQSGQVAQQLALAIQLNDEATLQDFCWHGNALLQQQITHALQGQGPHQLYIWGTAGSGKSHLLQACCQATHDNQQSAIYLPLPAIKHNLYTLSPVT